MLNVQIWTLCRPIHWHCQKYIIYTSKQLEYVIKKRKVIKNLMKSGIDIKYTELAFAVCFRSILLKH